MSEFISKDTLIGVVGAGTMGSGIAQLAATAGHSVVLRDVQPEVIEKARQKMEALFARLVEKQKLTAREAKQILGRIHWTVDWEPFRPCGLVIEAVVEDLAVKKQVFQQLEALLSPGAWLATNTSSLSVTAIAAACRHRERVLGLHFFNPAPLMALVEIVPGLDTSPEVILQARRLMERWGKTPVVAKDTPGFIVNRVARPFYGEALRILEEGQADVPTIDWAMKEMGGFRMGPFELMDLIGNDVNLKVTETVWKAFFYDPRYRPSFTQQRLVVAGYLGRKTGRGYYDYREGGERPGPTRNPQLGEAIFFRILCMLVNEAVDAVFWKIATVEDVDLAMTRGVNYPKGLLRWGDELGLENVLGQLEALQAEYGEDRYRPSPLLRKMVRERQTFYGRLV